MRRRSFITVALILISSMLSRTWAVDVAAMKNVNCHHITSRSTSAHSGQNGKKHHCDGEESGEITQSPAHGTVINENDSQPCPMNCCEQGTLRSSTALVAACFIPVPLALGFPFQFSSIVFVSSGYSAHTDRGPPIF